MATTERNSMSPRVICVIPGCDHSSKQQWLNHEWICGSHWRAVPARLRQRRHNTRSALRRRGEVRREEIGGRYVALTDRARRIEALVWSKLKAAALAGAAGL